jgi:hypothetical protein
MREPRLGDDIDDFCVRCKRVMNHSIVSVVNGEPAKVRCRTCHNDHDYRHEQPPPPKVDPKKAALFNEVLKKVDPDDAAEAEVDAEVDAVAEDEASEQAAPAPAPVAKAKAKAKAKGKK